MSFDNKYENRKDWRREYYGCKAVDKSCRNGGDCPRCHPRNSIKEKKIELTTKEQYKEVLSDAYLPMIVSENCNSFEKFNQNP